MVPKTIGIIGLGYMGMIHARNLIDLGCKVYGEDTDIAKIGELIKLGGLNMEGEKPYCGLDALIVSTPSDDHSFQLLCDGVHQHMFVEKPVGVDKADAIELTHLLPAMGKAGRVLMVGNNMRYHPAVKQAKEWLAENKIGRPKEAMFSIRQFKASPRDCLMLNWGSHAVDLARYLLGDFTLLHSGMEKTGDMAYLKLAGADDLDITVTLDYFLPGDGLNQFIITGTRGWIKGDLLAYTASCHSQNDGDEIVWCTGKWNDMYIEEIQEFLRRIDGQEPDGIGATGADGLACLDLLLEAKAKAVE
jgi:predicted dehydrogenase